MRAVIGLAISIVGVLGLVGCDSNETVKMPDVTGKKLDVAYDQIENAGVVEKDKINIEGGGFFGVLIESNWTVCEQSPAPGQALSGAPTLTVDRACSDDTVSEGPSSSPGSTPTEDPTPTPSATPSETRPEVLTAKNNNDFAALLKLGDNCSNKVTQFANEYEGRRVKFDGSVAALTAHGSFKTRFDMMVGAGDFDPNTASGPTFQFSDKNAFDMNLTGKKIPGHISVGQNYTFVADLGDYDADTCLYQLSPIETKVRS